LPIQLISASPTPTPTETPTTNSPTRRNRCPSETPRHTTAAIGAKNGWGCPITNVAANQANPADRALWTIGNAAPRHRVSPRPTASLTAPTTHPDPASPDSPPSLGPTATTHNLRTLQASNLTTSP